MKIELTAIATVKNERTAPTDDNWGAIISTIELAEHIPTAAFDNIELFSHLEILYYFDKAEKDKVVYSRHPRGNTSYPTMGIFAQRNKDRPNAIGLCTVELTGHEGRRITVRYLDAIDGTPVLDIKPVFKEFGVKTGIRQPDWVGDLMRHYWTI